MRTTKACGCYTIKDAGGNVNPTLHVYCFPCSEKYKKEEVIFYHKDTDEYIDDM